VLCDDCLADSVVNLSLFLLQADKTNAAFAKKNRPA
jgi:hypothetical protein